MNATELPNAKTLTKIRIKAYVIIDYWIIDNDDTTTNKYESCSEGVIK